MHTSPGARGAIVRAAFLVCMAARPAVCAPASPPSLAKINGLLDQTRDYERKGNWAPVPALYAQVVAACGEPVPQHLKQVVVRSLVKSGHASLALGKLEESEAAYRDAAVRFAKDYARDVRPWMLQALTLAGRVAEIRMMKTGAVSTTPVPASPVSRTAEPEPLVLVTDQGAAGAGTVETDAGAKGFAVQTFEGDEATLIRTAESRATAGGRIVLKKAHEMAVVTRDILPGSCWDWVHAVFERAGFPMGKKRETVAKSPKAGPYVDPSKIRPGDWLYYRNRSYGNIEHSGIFVGWINAATKVALVMSYPGSKRQEPGRYRPYELTGVFRIIRPA